MARKNLFDTTFENQEDQRKHLIIKYKSLNSRFRYELELFTYFSPSLIDIIQPICKKIKLNQEGFLTLNVEALNSEEKEWIENNKFGSLGHWKSGKCFGGYALGCFSTWSYIPLRPSKDREEILLKKMLTSEIKIYHESFIEIAEQIKKMDQKIDDIEDDLWHSGYYADNSFNNLISEFGEDIIPDRE
ncbi:hypothetical protein [Nostoc sp.]|uniref:hypothetical protein n=1 Tax=Nostoc sp. TaxID=1180 RepID=UPI002FF90192